MCKSIGDTYVHVYCREQNKTLRILVKDVLISEKFPTHIMSEIVLFSKDCTGIKDLKTWRFNKPDGSWLLDASQHVKGSTLYYVNTKPPAEVAHVLVTAPVVAGVQDAQMVNISNTPALVQPLRDSARIADAGINVTTAVLTTDQMAALTPLSVKEAVTGPYKEQWLQAILKDFVTLRTNKCFINRTAVPPPASIRFFDVDQRYRNKYTGPPAAMRDLPPEVYNARAMVMGTRLQHGIHYDETAAPVICTPTNKMLITVANARAQLLLGWDVKAAFYVGGIDKPGIVARLPLGFDHIEDRLRPINAPRLSDEVANGLAGTPQRATRAWDSVGFYPSPADPCLLLHESSQAATTMHVDDGILAVASLAAATALFAELQKTGYVFTWGPLKRSLGIGCTLARTPADMPPTPVTTDNDGVRFITADITLPAANRDSFKTIVECRERVHLNKEVLPVRVASSDNIADCLTKPSLKCDKRLLALARPASLTADVPKQVAQCSAAVSRGHSEPNDVGAAKRANLPE
jgi:hypothetical protein